MKISDIKKLKHGDPVEGVLTCVLSDVGEKRPFTAQDGSSFTLQNAKLSQGQDWIFCEFSNMSDVSIVDGHEVELRCVTSQHGTQGVMVKIVERGSNKFHNVRVTPSAKFMIGKLINKPVASKRQQLKQQRDK